MDQQRIMFVNYGTGLRKQHTSRKFEGSVDDFLESIKKYNCKFIEVYEKQDGKLVLLWSNDKRGELQQVEQMELF